MKAGDQISTDKPHYWFTAALVHHGIYLGDSTVVHFTRCKNGQALVLRTNIRGFSKNGEVKVVDYEDLQKKFGNSYWKEYQYKKELNEYCDAELKPTDEIIQRALKAVGDIHEYRVLDQNCEHFATVIRKGITFSEQVVYQVSEASRGLGQTLVSVFLNAARRNASQRLQHKPKDGLYYIGSHYVFDGHRISENYIKDNQIDFGMPPTWHVNINNEWTPIDQKQLPYPLKETYLFFADDSGEQYFYEIK